MKQRTAQVQALNDRLRAGLAAFPTVEINSPAGSVPEILNFSENRIKSETMLSWLSEQQVYVSSASACGRGQPSHTLAAMGRSPRAIDTAIRVSFCADNTPEDVDAFLERFEGRHEDFGFVLRKQAGPAFGRVGSCFDNLEYRRMYMQEVIIGYQGEMSLKGLNRNQFESALMKILRYRLKDAGRFNVWCGQSTFYMEPEDDNADLDLAFERVSKVFGLAAVSRSAVCEKDFDAICRTAEAYLGETLRQVRTFKVEARRADKTFPWTAPP